MNRLEGLTIDIALEARHSKSRRWWFGLKSSRRRSPKGHSRLAQHFPGSGPVTGGSYFTRLTRLWQPWERGAGHSLGAPRSRPGWALRCITTKDVVGHALIILDRLRIYYASMGSCYGPSLLRGPLPNFTPSITASGYPVIQPWGHKLNDLEKNLYSIV